MDCRACRSPESASRQRRATAALLVLGATGAVASSASAVAGLAPPVAATSAVTPAADVPPARTATPRAAEPVGRRADAAAAFADIAWVTEQEIASGHIPGAVVLIGSQDRILYRRAFGRREIAPRSEPMTANTVFDLASLTKVVATTTAVMQLVEQGRLQLDAPAARYWPAFAAHGKAPITVRELLTHTSGLPPDLDLSTTWAGHAAAMRLIEAQRPAAVPGTRYIYSDINFIVLGELIERITSLPLNLYCQRYIFAPLGMHETGFVPPAALQGRIAPTQWQAGLMLRGRVHDPTARRMGGIAGHAGLFSTADDLARFAQTLLRGGLLAGGGHLLQPATIALMTRPERVASELYRGLGWNEGPPFSAERGTSPPFGAFGHTGYTGTALWIDPTQGQFWIVLTNRVHPDGRGDAQPLRTAVAEVLTRSSPAIRAVTLPTAVGPPGRPVEAASTADDTPLRLGTDALADDDFAALRGLRIGLITNQTGRTADGERTVDRLRQAPGVQLAALFTPEHGMDGRADTRVPDRVDPASGLPTYSLYGTVLRPTDSMLAGLDALVFDVQDSGTRFYTYITTMAYAMQAAARKGLLFVVLDRPNPIDAAIVQGPLLDASLRSFTGFFPLPLRHGMTVGELARLFNAQAHIGAHLLVIPMRGYRRDTWYDQTGLTWRALSPHLQTLTQTTLYPGVGVLEGANVSVGRGTPWPFEVLGAPWIKATELTAYLAHRHIAGVDFAPAQFTPATDRYRDQPCYGVRMLLVDRRALDAGRLAVELESALERLYPAQFELDGTLSLLGSRQVLQRIRAGEDPVAITRAWRAALATFLALRHHYLLYPEGRTATSVRLLQARNRDPSALPRASHPAQ